MLAFLARQTSPRLQRCDSAMLSVVSDLQDAFGSLSVSHYSHMGMVFPLSLVNFPVCLGYKTAI